MPPSMTICGEHGVSVRAPGSTTPAGFGRSWTSATRRPSAGRGAGRSRRHRVHRRGVAPLSAKDAGVGGVFVRSFFRFLRGRGLGAEGLEDAVPMVPHRRNGLVRHLDSRAFSELIASLRRRRPATCATGRSSCAWPGWASGPVRSASCGSTTSSGVRGVISVRTRKTGHGARLPITDEVGRALAVPPARPARHQRPGGVRPGAPAAGCPDQREHRGTSGA